MILNNPVKKKTSLGRYFAYLFMTFSTIQSIFSIPLDRAAGERLSSKKWNPKPRENVLRLKSSSKGAIHTGRDNISEHQLRFTPTRKAHHQNDSQATFPELRKTSFVLRKGTSITEEFMQQYFVFDHRTGRLNTQIQNYMAAMYWAKKLNRTLVIPGWDEHHCINSKRRINYGNVPFDRYFDWVYFKSRYPRVIKRDDYVKQVIPKLGSGQLKIRSDLKNTPTEYANHHQILIELSQENATHLGVGGLHKWYIPEHIQVLYMGFLKPRQEIIDEGQRWIDEKLKKPYAAIHLRRWEGKCTMPLEDIAEHIEKHYDRKVYASFFIASDRQDMTLTRDIRRRYHGSIYHNSSAIEGVYSLGMVDSYILSFASLLFSNRFSTMSLNANLTRVSLCNHPQHDEDLCHSEIESPWCPMAGQPNKWCNDTFKVVNLKPLHDRNIHKC
eukprot:TRINITY_DN11361_c0_g1_i1.p1 TRINITY_DN11361_c0_g1~~TRINITY_DN11361_c0_g1_i1.p1  ORF type:complete len:441 (+),score=54.49 TRINITY_DN11361_c0_g1_i1:186-1508(+)